MQRPRWPFTAALVLLIGGLAIKAAAFDVVYIPMTAEERQESKRFAETFDRAQPAAELLKDLELPAGLSDCNPDLPDTTARTHMICWRGTPDAVPAAAQLSKNLRSLGATAVVPVCAKKEWDNGASMTMCKVTGDILGEHFVATVRQSPTKPGGAPTLDGIFVSGGVGELPFLLPMPLKGTPVPVPGA